MGNGILKVYVAAKQNTMRCRALLDPPYTVF